MDFHEIWQENKRWILGCVAGLLLFWIGRSVIDSIYDTKTVDDSIRSSNSKISAPQYRKKQLAAATADSEKLERAYQVVEQAMALKVPERFDLEGKGDPDLYWVQQKSQVRDALLNLAAEANVDLGEGAFQWPAPVQREEIRIALVGLHVLDEAVRRLIQAHQDLLRKQPDALGLREIAQLKIESPKSRSFARASEFQPDDHVDPYTVSFTARVDYRTVHDFLERCRVPGRPIGLEDPSLEQGRRSGEPLTFKGRFVGCVVKPLVTEEEGL